MSNVASSRRLLPLLYLVGFVLLADQIADVSATVLLQPGTTGTANWRFAVFGIAVSRSNILIIADVLLFIAATGLEHRMVLRVLGVLHILLALVLGLGLALFGLDALEVQRVVLPAGRSAFMAAAGRAATVALFGMVLLGWTGVVALRMSRASNRRGGGHREGLLISVARDQPEAK